MFNKTDDETETTLTYQDAATRSVSVNMTEDVGCKRAWESAPMPHPTLTQAGGLVFRLAKN